MTVKKSEASDSTAGSAADKAKAKEPRRHVRNGIAYDIFRTYYDVKSNTVFDVIIVPRMIRNNLNGQRERVEVHRRVICTDEAIQAKYRRNDSNQVEVTVDE